FARGAKSDRRFHALAALDGSDGLGGGVVGGGRVDFPPPRVAVKVPVFAPTGRQIIAQGVTTDFNCCRSKFCNDLRRKAFAGRDTLPLDTDREVHHGTRTLEGSFHQTQEGRQAVRSEVRPPPALACRRRAAVGCPPRPARVLGL